VQKYVACKGNELYPNVSHKNENQENYDRVPSKIIRQRAGQDATQDDEEGRTGKDCRIDELKFDE